MFYNSTRQSLWFLKENRKYNCWNIQCQPYAFVLLLVLHAMRVFT